MILVLIVLIIYFAATAIISIVLQKKSKNLEGYYLGQRNLPWPVVMLTFAATWIGASSTLGKSGLAYEIGISAVLPTFATVFAFAVFCLFAGRIQRIGQKYHILSIPDLITKRFGRLPALIASAIIGWTVIGTAGTQMVASSKILQMVMADDWEISYQTALVVTTVIVIAYTTLSGFYGVAYTDTLQGILLIVVIGVALPVAALTKIGGPAQLVASLPKHYFELKFDRSIVSYMVVYLLYFLAGPPYWQRSFAASSSKVASKGAIGGNVIILFYSFAVTIIGVCALVLYPSFPKGVSHEMLIPLLVKESFPPILYALVITSLIAIVMSTIDSYLLLASQTLCTDLLLAVHPGIKPETQLKLSRYSVVVIGLFALLFALRMENILEALVLSMSYFASAIAIPAIAALLSKKAKKLGITMGMMGGFISSVVWKSLLGNPFGIPEVIVGSLMSLGLLIVGSVIDKRETVFLD